MLTYWPRLIMKNQIQAMTSRLNQAIEQIEQWQSVLELIQEVKQISQSIIDKEMYIRDNKGVDRNRYLEWLNNK